MLFIAIAMFTVSSCSDNDDDDKTQDIEINSLPAEARNFISTYFPGETAQRVIHQPGSGDDSYEVTLASGAKVDFDNAGRWTEVDGAPGKPVPAGILPQAIYEYTAINYPAAFISDVSREIYGYEVGLNNNVDLMFNAEGKYIGVD